jgi:hypothetical protein
MRAIWSMPPACPSARSRARSGSAIWRTSSTHSASTGASHGPRLRRLFQQAQIHGVGDRGVRPGLELSIRDSGWRNYDAIVAYVNSSGGELRRLMSEVFGDTAHLFLDYVRKVLPDASEEELYWGGLTSRWVKPAESM